MSECTDPNCEACVSAFAGEHRLAAEWAYLQACSELVERIAKAFINDPWHEARLLVASKP